MPLLSLPVELLTLIAEHSIEGDPELESSKRRHAIKNLRLTCKSLSIIARAATFETVNLYADDESDILFRKLRNHPEVRLLVRTVVLNTFYVDEEGLYNGRYWPWRSAVMRIGRFPNLKSVQVAFHNDVNQTNDGTVPCQDISFRTDVLRATFAALNNRKCPTPNLRTLTIKNLQALNSSEVTESPHFKAVLSRLSELHLSIATPTTWDDNSALHEFFNQLPSIWLEPTQNRLTHLTLYAPMYWGWAPKFDPRGLYFPNLNYLALGNHTFTHDWQVDWILSHRSSLESLILDDCPIPFCIHPSDALRSCISNLCHDNHTEYPKHQDDPRSIHLRRDENIWLFDSRWHNFFLKFETGLLYLTKFVYGYSTLNSPKYQLKKYAFELRDFMLPALRPWRYLIFDGRIGPCPNQWVIPYSDHEFEILESWFPFDDKEGNHKEVLVRSPALIEPTCLLTENIESNYDSEEDAELWQFAKWKEMDRKDEERRLALLYPVQDGQGCQKQDEEAFIKLLSTVHRRAREKGIA